MGNIAIGIAGAGSEERGGGGGTYSRVPTAQGKQGKQGKWPNKFPVRETQGIWKFCLDTGKTQGILLAQVVNVLILKVKDIAIAAAKKTHFFPEAG